MEEVITKRGDGETSSGEKVPTVDEALRNHFIKYDEVNENKVVNINDVVIP